MHRVHEAKLFSTSSVHRHISNNEKYVYEA